VSSTKPGTVECVEFDEALPLPGDPLLAACAQALNAAGHWASVFDADFHNVFVTDELRRSCAGLQGLAPVAIGVHTFSPEALAVTMKWTSSPSSTSS